MSAPGDVRSYEQAVIDWRANFPLRREDVQGICDTPDICFEYNGWVRCGLCALKSLGKD